MDQILEWVKNIVIFQLFSVFFMGIFPKGENAKYIEMALNLLLIIVLVSPVITYFKMDSKDLESVIETFSVEVSESSDRFVFDESISAEKEKMLEEQITTILRQSSIEGEVQVKVVEDKNMRIQWIRIHVEQGKENQMKELSTELGKVYEISESKIYID